MFCINNVGTFLEKNIKGVGKPISLPVKLVEKGTEINNKVLWDVIHNNYKLNAYEILIKNETKNGVISNRMSKKLILKQKKCLHRVQTSNKHEDIKRESKNIFSNHYA